MTNITETMTIPEQYKERPTNVYWNGNKWYIAQIVNGEAKYYGTYKTLQEAIKVRNNLVKQGIITNRKGQHRIKNYQDRYVHKDGKKYTISKVVNGKQEYFGVYHTYEEAIRERDYLESIQWDYGNMD